MTYTMAFEFNAFDEANPDRTVRHEKEFPTLDAAEYAGMHIGCTKGCTRVEVLSPDGILQALWDKMSTQVIRKSYGFDQDGRELLDETHMSGRWQRLGDESIALGKADHERLMEKMRNGC